ncbi:MAG TPA: SPOR domain-containing protein, partial [bacterium]|nr:SPOR domain-containing protein [bacterium]
GQTFEKEKKDRQAYASYRTLLDRYPNALEAKDAQDRLTALSKVHPDYESVSAPENPTPSPTPGLTPAPTPVTAAAEPTAAPTPVPAESPEAEAPPQAQPKPFHVQVGVFTQKAYVAKAVKSLAKLGDKAFVVSAKSDSSPYTYYKVRSGQYATRVEAEKEAKKLSRLLKQQVIVVEDQGN